MSEHDEAVAKVADLLHDRKVAMLTTVGDGGRLMSRPMAMQEVEFDGDVWLFAQDDAPQLAEIAAQPQVNLALSSLSSWVSLAGRASVVRDDVAKKRELWNAGTEAWLPQGADDPSVVLIRVEADSAEYWDTPGGVVATAFSFAKAKVTGERYDGGENAKVGL